MSQTVLQIFAEFLQSSSNIFFKKRKVEWNITNFCHEKICLILFFRLRWQTPNAQYPDKEVLTQSLSSKKAPKVIVTGTTFESFTLSFDHFAPQGYEHEYVVLFKPVRFIISSRCYYYYVFKYLQILYFNFYDFFKVSTSKWIPKEESVSNKDLPSITIRNLKPNTQYEARIAIYDDYNTRSLGKSTKTISVRI